MISYLITALENLSSIGRNHCKKIPHPNSPKKKELAEALPGSDCLGVMGAIYESRDQHLAKGPYGTLGF